MTSPHLFLLEGGLGKGKSIKLRKIEINEYVKGKLEEFLPKELIS